MAMCSHLRCGHMPLQMLFCAGMAGAVMLMVCTTSATISSPGFLSGRPAALAPPKSCSLLGHVQVDPTLYDQLNENKPPTMWGGAALNGGAVAVLAMVALVAHRSRASASHTAGVARAPNVALHAVGTMGQAPDFSKELGACPPLGFWDPLELSKFDDPGVAVAQFKRRRVIELQHGRVSMLACIGYMVPEFIKWPGYISPSSGLAFADVPNGFGALSTISLAGWTQMVALVGLIEINNLQTEPRQYPGDYDNFGPFGLPFAKSINDQAKKEKSLLAEINNGRLAMMAIIGIWFQNGLTGTAWGNWELYTDSPLR